MERVRLVSSGTEAAMTAFRLARGCTGRDKLLKFSGCYHGHSDSLLVEAGSGVAGIAQASSAGVPAELAAHTLVAPYNNPRAVSEIVDRHGDALAAIAVEPVAGNMGLVLPEPGFLEHLRREADRCGALLVFDEVITGFRLTFGGLSEPLRRHPRHHLPRQSHRQRHAHRRARRSRRTHGPARPARPRLPGRNPERQPGLRRRRARRTALVARQQSLRRIGQAHRRIRGQPGNDSPPTWASP